MPPKTLTSSSDAGRGAVLVTGSSTGIGRATALQLDQLGFRVFAAVRTDQDAESLRAEASPRLTPQLLDVTDRSSIARAADRIAEQTSGQGLVGLVNNAGVAFSSPLELVPEDKLRWLFEVNVFGVVAVTQAFLPLVRAARGRIVNISSTATLVVAPFHGTYSATKMALNALTHALRLELRSLGVQVCLIICGSVRTPIWGKGRQVTDQIREQVPTESLGVYGAAFRRMGQGMTRVGQKGISPERAGRTVVRCLTDKRPRNTYYIGTDALLYQVLDRLVVGRARDRMILRSLGLDG